MLGYVVEATDGEVGSVSDFLIDEDEWTVRHVVVDTARWLFGRKVLLSPSAVDEANWAENRLKFPVTKEKIESSPEISEDMPVSRKKELEMMRHYGWPAYWTPIVPPRAQPAQAIAAIPEHPEDEADESVHLRSVEEILNYRIDAEDGEMGRATDLIVEEGSWNIRYLVVDTGTWLPGRKVLVSKDWLDGVSWKDKEIHVDLKRKEIEDSPPYDPYKPVNREYETVLYDYYGRPHYWRED